MIQKDYMMRAIQQMTQALTRILFRKDNEQYQDALDDIQHAGQLFLGLDLNAIQTLRYEDLRDALQVRKANDVEHISILAELLRHQGDCFEAEGQPDAALHSYILALDLYLDLVGTGDTLQLADLPTRVDILLDHIDPHTLDADLLLKLFRFFDAAGRYAEAEDVLFFLADKHPTPRLNSEGTAFFERLLRKSHRYLKAGNLPYEEVKEGLAAFRLKMQRDS